METNQATPGIWGRFTRWRREEHAQESPLSNAILHGVIALATDPVLFVVIFGPILIQVILQIVTPQVGDVPADIRMLVRADEVCGITTFTLTLYTAFLSWAIFLGSLFRGNIAILKDHWSTVETMPGRQIRLTIIVIMFVGVLVFGLNIFFLGGAAMDLMAYQFGHCYELGSLFDVPPFNSYLTWLRLVIVICQVAIFTFNLAPSHWNLSKVNKV